MGVDEDREARPASPLRWGRRLIERAARAPRPRLSLAQATIVATILVAGLVAGAMILDSERDAARTGQERWAERAARALREEVEQATLLTRAARGVMEGAEAPSQAEFAHFAAVSMEGTHLLALTWMPRVTAAERPEWERLAGHQITRFAGIARPTRIGRKEVYFPVADLAPRAEWTDLLLGLDPGTIPGLAATRSKARDRGAVVMAPQVQLAGTTALGMTLFAPVFRAGAPIGGVAGRRAALRGYVAATYRLSDIVDEAFEALPAGARMQITDAGRPLEGSSPGRLREPSRETVTAGGRRLEVLVSAGDGASLVPALLAVAGGALVSGLVAFVLLLANRRRDEGLRAAAEDGALLRVATAVAVVAPPEQVFRLVAGEAAALLGAEVGAVYRFTASGPVRAGAGGPGEPDDLLAERPADGVVAEVARTGAPARLRSGGPALAREWVAAPVRVGGVVWGAVAVATKGAAPIDKDAPQRMDRFARLTAVAIADAEARDALRASEDRFRTLAVHAPVGIFQTDAEGRCEFAHERWRQLTGRGEADLLGAHWTEALHPDDRDRALARWHRRDLVAEEYRCLAADGRVSWVAGSVVELLGPGGAVVGYLATFGDVTERRRAEEELRSERDYAESLLEAMQDGLVLLAPDGRISEVSRGFCELTGFARHELLGSTAPYPYWPESTTEGVGRGFARLRDAGSHEWDLPFRTRDGRRVDVILRASVLRDAAGGTVGYLATVKDVTERRRAEDELRHQAGIVNAVLDTAPEAILMVDHEGRPVISNPAADRLSAAFGGTGDPGSDAAADLTTDPAAYRDAVALLAEDPAVTTTHEFELVTSGRIFRRYSAPVRADGADTIVGRLFVTDDVTDERRADRAKDEFIQLASHELRTPLTSILGYLELLQDEEETGDALTPEQRRFVDVVHRNAQRLLLLVGDLLVVARADAGRLGLEMEPVDLQRLVCEAAEAQRLVAEERRIALSAEARPLALRADRGRLAEVIDNLLSNALKFTPPGGRVTVRAGRDAAGAAVIEVADTGMGIPAAEQERLFERFYRTQAALTAAIPGTGLGLTISKMIVEAHGGRIGVESEEGRGTAFRIWLPAAAAGEVDATPAALPAPPAG